MMLKWGFNRNTKSRWWQFWNAVETFFGGESPETYKTFEYPTEWGGIHSKNTEWGGIHAVATEWGGTHEKHTVWEE